MAVIDGTWSDDTLYGGNEDDLLNGGFGDDTMAGGAGNDSYLVNSLNDVIIETASGGTDTVYIQIGGDVALSRWANVENARLLELGGSGASNLAGTDAGNQLIGNSQANRIEGLGGDDFLLGAGGKDTLLGGLGNDVYLFGPNDGQDLIIDEAGALDLLVMTDRSTQSLQFSRAGDDLLVKVKGNTDQVIIQSWFTANADGIEGIVTTDALLDHAAVASLMKPPVRQVGTDGDDHLTATDLGSADTLVGGLGNDTYSIASSEDVVVEKAGEGIDSIYASFQALDSHYSLDTPEAIGVENFYATSASTGNLTLTGNALDNIIAGNQHGNGLFTGGRGNDSLHGGLGIDSYFFSRGDGQDLIVDAGGRTDQIVFDGIETSDLRFNRHGDDLVVSVKDSNDQATLQSWFNPAVDGVDYIGTGSGDFLDHSAVNQLLQSMATFAPASAVTGSALTSPVPVNGLQLA